MTNSFRCPECGSANPVLTAVNESILAIAEDLALEPTLRKIAEVARALVHASYAAIGVTDEDGFSQFIVSGMSDEQARALGPMPAHHGLLWDILASGRVYRTSDLEQHSTFAGWPEHHPPMRSLLGVPVVSRDAVIGAFYLANENTWGFSSADQELIEMLAMHAGIAIDNARLYEQSRELSVIQERNRLARELHDSVTQMLFSIELTAETVRALADVDAEMARVQLKKLSEMAKDAQREMRSLIFELRPSEVEAVGLAASIRKHVEVLRETYPLDIHVSCDDLHLPPPVAGQVLRVVQEALNNTLKHSSARRVEVRVERTTDGVIATVWDDGVGFDPNLPAQRRNHFGLVSMHERAASVGATLEIASAPGRGTEVRLHLKGPDR